MPNEFLDNPVLHTPLLLEALNRQEETSQTYQTYIVDLKEQIKLPHDRLFGHKCQQTVEPKTPQSTPLNEIEPIQLPIDDAEEELVAPIPCRGSALFSADLPRIEVIHELPEHEFRCGCRKLP